MPREKVAGIIAAYGEWSRRDFDVWVERFTEDVVWDISAAFFDQEPIRGREALRRWCDEVLRAWDDLRIEHLETLEESDDRLTELIRLTGRGRTTGVVGRPALPAVLRVPRRRDQPRGDRAALSGR